MSRSDFYTTHHLGKAIYIWINQRCEKLTRKKFLDLPNNLEFVVDGSGHSCTTAKDSIIT